MKSRGVIVTVLALLGLLLVGCTPPPSSNPTIEFEGVSGKVYAYDCDDIMSMHGEDCNSAERELFIQLRDNVGDYYSTVTTETPDDSLLLRVMAPNQIVYEGYRACAALQFSNHLGEAEDVFDVWMSDYPERFGDEIWSAAPELCPDIAAAQSRSIRLEDLLS